MNTNTRTMLDAVAILNATDQPKLIAGIWLHQENGNSTYVKTAIVDGVMIYAKADRGAAWLMLPVDQLVGVEFDLNKHPDTDGKTLPEIINFVTQNNNKKKAA
jgi:hypothetical protein